MATRLLLAAALIALSGGWLAAEPAPQAERTPILPQSSHRAPLAERVAAARSVKVKTSILGVALNSSLEDAHKKLDRLCSPAHPPKEESSEAEGENSGRKVLWQLEETDYSSVFVKTDERQRITYILVLLRPGKELPFGAIGETAKAPVQTERIIAWDVLRPPQPLIRVVAEGAARKARSITMFIVKRPSPMTSQQRK